MKNSNTPLSNTKVYPIEGNVYRAIIPFNDHSSLNILFKYGGMGVIEPCTLQQINLFITLFQRTFGVKYIHYMRVYK